MKRPNKTNWISAINNEYKSFLENNTRDIVDPPKFKIVFSTDCVFKTKRNPKGKIEHYKTTLIAKDSDKPKVSIAQKYGENPVIKYSSIRFVFALALKYNLQIHHMHVTTVYLQGNLDYEICIYQPENFKRNKKKIFV